MKDSSRRYSWAFGRSLRLIALLFLLAAMAFMLPDRAATNVGAQVPPVGGGVDSDDDPNEVDDGLPDSILDPEDLIPVPAPAAPAPAAPAPAAPRPPAVSVAPTTPQVAAPQPAARPAQPILPAQQPQPAAPVAPGPAEPAVASCEVIEVPGERPRGPITIEVSAQGAQEVPPVNTIGSAFARFTFDESVGTLGYFVTAFGFSPDLITAAHIHRGAPGVNGPIVQFISPTGFVQANGTLQLTAADIGDLKSGNLYFNVHSFENPGGFARAQLVIPTPQSIQQIVCREPEPPLAVRPAQRPATTPMRIAPPSTGSGGLLED